MIWLFFIPAGFLLLGIADMPSGYYTFMRIVVFFTSCLMAFASYKENEKIEVWTVLFALMAVLFNPIIPIYLHDKDIWTVLDIIGAAIFGIKGFITLRKSK